MYPKIEETGNQYGALTVLSFVPMKPKGKWLCKCACGKEKLAYGSDLRKGKITSCGCRFNTSVQETPGTKYGFLTVLERDPTPPKDFADKCIHWICRCEKCGTIISVSGRNLRTGHTQSCGCMKSAGEAIIAQILNKNNLKYKKEYKYQDLRTDHNTLLRFDFCIFNEDESENMLIEFQGPQHFKDTGFWKDVNLEQRQYYDELKQKYCEEHALNLLVFIYGNKSPLQQEEEIEKEILNFYELNKETKNYGKIFDIYL